MITFIIGLLALIIVVLGFKLIELLFDVIVPIVLLSIIGYCIFWWGNFIRMVLHI